MCSRAQHAPCAAPQAAASTFDLKGQCRAGETLPNASVRDVGRLLNSRGYAVFLRDGALYAFKGIAGRFAPIAVHVSLLAILIGAAFGALAGFDGQVLLPEGGQVLVANVLRSAGTAIPGLPLPEGARRVLRLDRFDIDYRSDGSIGQYRSVLTAEDLDGNAVQQKEIYVNEPMRFGGVTIYQVRVDSPAWYIKTMLWPMLLWRRWLW
jgi:cytochrome c biogenesis protein